MKQHLITLVISTCGTILGLCFFGMLTGFDMSTDTANTDYERTESNIPDESANNKKQTKKYYYIDKRGYIHTSRDCMPVVTFGAERVTNEEPLEYESICYICVTEEEQDEIEALAK